MVADQNHARNEAGWREKTEEFQWGQQRTEHDRFWRGGKRIVGWMEKPDSRPSPLPSLLPSSLLPLPPLSLSLTFEASMYRERGLRSRLMPVALDAIWEQSTERHAANQTGRVLARLTSDLPASASPLHHPPRAAQPSLCHLSCVLSDPFDPLHPIDLYRANLGARTSPFSFRGPRMWTLCRRFESTISLRGAAQRSDSCIIRHPARHYNALLLLIESIVSRLAVALTVTAKSAKSRRATWCSKARDSSLGMVSLDRGTARVNRLIERETFDVRFRRNTWKKRCVSRLNFER